MECWNTGIVGIKIGKNRVMEQWNDGIVGRVEGLDVSPPKFVSKTCELED